MAVGVLTNVSCDEVAGTFSATLTADASPSACSIFMGFKPRVIRCTQVSGTIGNGAFTSADIGMSAANMIQTVANGTTTLVTTNGYTFLDGSEAAPAAKATNSPASSGPGVTLGTSVQATASAAYRVEAWR